MLIQSNYYFHTCVISWCRNSIECADSSWFCLLFSSWTNRGWNLTNWTNSCWNLTNTLDRKNSRLTDSPPSEGPARGRDIWQAFVGGTCAPHSPACPFAPWWSKNILTSSRTGVVFEILLHTRASHLTSLWDSAASISLKFSLCCSRADGGSELDRHTKLIVFYDLSITTIEILI